MPAHDFTGSLDDLRNWIPVTGCTTLADYQRLLCTGSLIGTADPGYIALKTYLESAHRDARDHFHEICSIDLHPGANGPGGRVEYPNRLIGRVRKGLFGEALCGVITESWLLLAAQAHFTVPVFLFRFHSGVEEELSKLLDGGPAAEFAGRHGDDFLALELSPTEDVVRILVGEAKFRTEMTPGGYHDVMVTEDKVLPKLSTEPSVPRSITKLNRLLGMVDATRFEAIRASLEQIHLRQATAERVDMVLLVYEDHAKRTPPPYAPTTAKPTEHTAARPLLVVELHLPGANALMDSLYPVLYR